MFANSIGMIEISKSSQCFEFGLKHQYVTKRWKHIEQDHRQYKIKVKIP